MNLFLDFCNKHNISTEKMKERIEYNKRLYGYGKIKNKIQFDNVIKEPCINCEKLNYIDIDPINYCKVYRCKVTGEFYGLIQPYCLDNLNDFTCDVWKEKIES